MTKEDIVDRLRDVSETLTKKEAADLLNKLLDIFKTSLKEEGEIKISSFGRFYIQERKPRLGRNPKTGEEAQIRAGKTIKFKAGKPLRTSVLN